MCWAPWRDRLWERALNDALDALEIAELGTGDRQVQGTYEQKWNRLHLIRTVFAVLSFLLSLLVVFTHTKAV